MTVPSAQEKFAPGICHSSQNPIEVQDIAKVRIFDNWLNLEWIRIYDSIA